MIFSILAGVKQFHAHGNLSNSAGFRFRLIPAKSVHQNFSTMQKAWYLI